MPSFISFEMLQGTPPQHVHGVRDGGRIEMIFGPSARPHWHQRGAVPAVMNSSAGSAARALLRAFLNATLRPLVAASAATPARRRAIHAWAIINEPDWAIHRGSIDAPYGELGNTLLRSEGMLAFFEEAAAVISAYHFPISIGFANGRVPSIPTFGTWLASRAWRGSYIHQHHHYPKKARGNQSEVSTVPYAGEMAAHPCYVGEFPTRFRDEPAIAQGIGDHDPQMERMDWKLGPWLDGPWDGGREQLAETNRLVFVARRLRLMEERGYAGSLGWVGLGALGDQQYGWTTDRAGIIAGYTNVTGGRP